MTNLPVGKLPAELLAQILARAPILDKRLLLGPGPGLDCAVLDYGDTLLVFTSDPITFATHDIGWYAVQVNANDIVSTGATPRWMLATLLLPEGQADPALAERISEQLFDACRQLGISLIGGHTEITAGLPRPVLSGTMVGEVAREQLVTPRGAQPGDRLLLTKGVPIEATALLANEFGERLAVCLSEEELETARRYLYSPGISVVPEATIAVRAGRVSAMHDPTEGGLAMALWELAEASGKAIRFDPGAVPVPHLSGRICRALGLDPLACIASGALLISAPPQEAAVISRSLEAEGIPCCEIGAIESGSPEVWLIKNGGLLVRPQRDAVARLYEASDGEA